MIRAALLLASLRACALAAPAPAPADTAGSQLRQAWALARTRYPDALLISVSGQADAAGAVQCDPDFSMQEGWRMTFYSPKAQEFVVVVECRGRLAGPLRQIMARDSGVSRAPVEGRFLDSDRALEMLRRSGALKELADSLTGKRPFSMTLAAMEDERFAGAPVIWTVQAGKASFLVDAVRREIFDPGKYLSPEAAAGVSSGAARGLALRPKRPTPAYTVRADFGRVAAMADKQYPGAKLMAIEGFADAWGGSPCTGAGDGWAFFYWHPKIKDFVSYYACAGKIGPGPVRYVPVDFGLHKPLESEFIDSDAAVDSVLVSHSGAMSEGLGRRYTRTGVLRLLNYRTSPFASSKLWQTTMVWHLEIGTSEYRIDGKKGTLIDFRE